MARAIPEYNFSGFAPTTAQAATIKDRQALVRRWAQGFMRDPAYARHTDAGTPGSDIGACYFFPIMMAKASIINLGEDLLQFWPFFRANMAVDSPRHFLANASPAHFASIGTRFSSTFYVINFTGEITSSGLWTADRVPGMTGFGVYENAEALLWLGEIGGTMHHEQHPHGTLIHLPEILTMEAGAIVNREPQVLFGRPPYTLRLGAPRPTWVQLNSAAVGHVFLQPPAIVVPREYEAAVVITDANNERDTATWIITVTAPQE